MARTVKLWNGRQVDRRLYWWAMGKLGARNAIRLAGDMGIANYGASRAPFLDVAQVTLMQEWMAQAGDPPQVKEK